MNELTKELLDALKACVDYGSMTGSEWVKEKAVAVIAKAEAAMAEPQPNADGWIKWAGGDRPVEYETLIQVRYRDGDASSDDSTAGAYRWNHIGSDGDIIAYRIAKVPQ